ncbi:MAG TPA: VTT domain-containing protein [Terriglobales bacterium]|nr:VTT domain-containing protein [Terriglobales bacterium]
MTEFAVLKFNLRWLVHLGGPGLILIGIVDQSFVPLPGSLDFATIVLTAGNPKWWPYYWFMATAAALLGAWITYRISRKGGQEALEKRLPHSKVEKLVKGFEKGGFWALFIGALLPPPLPMVPLVVGAGALQYPRRKFLLALGSGRVLRYGIIVWLAQHYGRHIIRVLRQNEILVIVSFVIFSVGAALIGWLWTRHQKRKEVAQRGAPEQAAA